MNPLMRRDYGRWTVSARVPSTADKRKHHGKGLGVANEGKDIKFRGFCNRNEDNVLRHRLVYTLQATFASIGPIWFHRSNGKGYFKDKETEAQRG